MSLQTESPELINLTGYIYSVANMEINLILSKMLWKYDMELVDNDLNWEEESRLHFLWLKPELRVRFFHRGDHGSPLADPDP